MYGNQVKVPGIAGNVNAQAFGGDASWTGYGIIAGRWYDAPGEVDVNTAFLSQSGLAVGGSATVNTGTGPAGQVTVRIVGEVLTGRTAARPWSPHADAGARPPPSVEQYDVNLRPGTQAASYAQSLNTRLGPGYFARPNDQQRGLPVILGLITALTLLLAVVAALGVLNTVVLYTRDRVHDLGVFKAVGMNPGQTLVMVVSTVALTGLVAGLAAVPAGIGLQRYLVSAMARHRRHPTARPAS